MNPFGNTGLLALVLIGCVHPIGGPLEDAREAQSPPPEGFELTYREREGPLGARDIMVASDGSLRLERWRPGFVPASDQPESVLRNADDAPSDEGAEVTQMQVGREDMARLVDVLVDIEGWKHRDTDDLPSAPVEGSRVTLVLTLGSDSSEAWEYGRDLEANDRLVRVRRVLDEILLRGAPAPAEE